MGALGRRFLGGFSGLAIALATWEVLVNALSIPPVTLPAPTAILKELAAEYGWYIGHTLYTVGTTLAGFSLAVVVGVLVAVLIVSSRLFESTFYPLIIAMNSVPKVAVAPLFVVWLGTGAEPKIAIAFLIAVFAVIVDAVLGLRSVPQDIRDLGHALRGTKIKIFLKIRFPIALPHIFSGMKVAIGLALVGAIVGEFVSSQKGLGYVILSAQGMFDTVRVFSAISILAMLGVVLFWVLALAENYLIPWHASNDHE
jgi:NitT/TauT family transport system permease protein